MSIIIANKKSEPNKSYYIQETTFEDRTHRFSTNEKQARIFESNQDATDFLEFHFQHIENIDQFENIRII